MITHTVGLFSLSDTIVSESDEEGVVLFVRVLSGFIDSDGVIVEFSFISGTADGTSWILVLKHNLQYS